MRSFIFTKNWKKTFSKLSTYNQEKCLLKLKKFKDSDIFFSNMKSIENLYPSTHRIRVWDIRMLIKKIDDDTYEVIKVWCRWDIYK